MGTKTMKQITWWPFVLFVLFACCRTILATSAAVIDDTTTPDASAASMDTARFEAFAEATNAKRGTCVAMSALDALAGRCSEGSDTMALIQTNERFGNGALYRGEDWSTNNCGQGILITSASECQSAAAGHGHNWKGSGSSWTNGGVQLPKGCSISPYGNVYHSTHGTGGVPTRVSYSPVCKKESDCVLMQRLANSPSSSYRRDFCTARLHEVLQDINQKRIDGAIPGHTYVDLGADNVLGCDAFSSDSCDNYLYKSAYNSNGEGIAQRQMKYEVRWTTLNLPVKTDGGTSTMQVLSACFKAMECFQGSYTEPIGTSQRTNMKCVVSKKCDILKVVAEGHTCNCESTCGFMSLMKSGFGFTWLLTFVGLGY